MLLALMLSLLTQIDADQSGLRDAFPSATKFSYDAVDSNGKRKTAKIYSGSEDSILDSGKRTKLQANARDLQRNYSMAGWMVRRHLDYVATFRFMGRNGTATDKAGKDLDDQIAAIILEKSKTENFDRANRHNLHAFLRLAEARSVLDGDLGIMRINDGRVQAIESDRIKNPTGMDSGDWVHGVRTDKAGAALQYAIWSRSKSGMEFDRIVPANNLHLLGYYDRFDQVRGVSPLASGLNSMRDVYENFNYALAKAKISQLLGIKWQRKASEAPGVVAAAAGDDSDDPRYEVSFGDGPWSVDLDPGDDVNLVESATPSTQFQAFMQGVIMVTLKALDLPYSFYDESHTNFFGSRGAWMHYKRACDPKRARLIAFLDWWTKWQLSLAVLNGELTLPKGMTVANVKFLWVPAGMPFWDPSKEINGHVQAISAGLDNPERIARENDGDVYDNIDIIAAVQDYAVTKGVTLSFAPVANQLILQETQPNG